MAEEQKRKGGAGPKIPAIRQNTGKAAQALIAAVLGGAGRVSRQTGSFRPRRNSRSSLTQK